MDWFFKSTSWDFGELQSQTDTSISSSNGLNNSSLKKKEDCSVDLKLGCIGDSLGIDGLLDVGSVTQLETKAAKSDPPKRARKVVISSQNVNCSVDGCKSDLSGCRDYHKKHKVCEAHAKTPIVMVDGVQQRFCQQCSRFHLLKEFDEIKRSCRKRLAGHNRRRRKVQPNMDSANSISFFNGAAGESFSLNPKIWTGNRKNGAWQGTSSVEHQPSANHLEQQTLFPLYSDNRRLSSSYQLHPNRITSSDSKSALSLLSLSNSSFDINALHSLQAERIPTAHPLIQTKCVTIYGGGDDWCFGKSSSQVSDYITISSLVSVERENQFRSFDEESTLDIAAAQTEPVYSPPANGMSVFWTS